MEDIEYFRYYRYLRRILDDDHYAIHDHFEPSPREKLEEIRKYTFSRYVHLPQHKFVEVLHERLDEVVRKRQDTSLLFGTDVLSIENQEDGVLMRLKDVQTEREYTMETDFLIACDGFHSRVRK